MARRFHCPVIGMAEDATAASLWRFSLMIYARPGVAKALIGLQDRGGHNVNLVLFGLWLAFCGGRKLDAAALARAAVAIAPLDRDVVAPLRRLRRALKGDPDPDLQAMRRRVLALELAAERRVQARLAASVTARPARTAARTVDRAALAEANLRLILGVDFASADAAAIRRAFPRS
jgi:uncharacterized protein (TIGR02444 family)